MIRDSCADSSHHPHIMRPILKFAGDRLQVALMLVLLAACSLNVMFLCARL